MYTATSVDVFIAAYSGCLGGMRSQRNVSQNVDPAHYAHMCNVALAFAESFDTEYANPLPNDLQLAEIESVVSEQMNGRQPGTGAALNASFWQKPVLAIIALLSEADAVVAANVTNPIPFPSPPAGIPVVQIATVVGVANSLKSTTPATSIAAIVDGYYVAGDKGAVPGGYFWDPTSPVADNGGTIINPTGHVGNGRWIAIYSGALYVTWFGAKGNGVFDDTSPILAAWGALGPNEGAKRGELFFPEPPVSYTLSSTWTIKTNFIASFSITGETGSGSGHNGVKIKWIGAAGGVMVHLLGAWNGIFTNIELDGNALAKYTMQAEGDVVRAVGTSDMQFNSCVFFNPRDNAGDRCFLFGEATGFQCDTFVFNNCLLLAQVPSTNAECFEALGGNNAGQVSFVNTIFAGGRRGIHWDNPVFANSMIGGGFVLTTVSGARIGGQGTPFAFKSINCEQVSGVIFEGIGISATSGQISVDDSNLPYTAGADDFFCTFTGFVKLHNNTVRNLRVGATEPRIFMSSGYAYGLANADCGIESVGNTYVGATIVPVFDEAGVAIMTAARLQATPAPVFSRGDIGGPLVGLLKLPPVDGKPPTLLSIVSGYMKSTSGALSAVATIPGADVTPDFVAQNITTTGNLTLTGAASNIAIGDGTTADAGDIRGEQRFKQRIRGAGAYNLDLFNCFGDLDRIIMGDAANVSRFDIQAIGAGFITLSLGGVDFVTINNGLGKLAGADAKNAVNWDNNGGVARLSFYTTGLTVQQQVTNNTTGAPTTQLVDVTTGGLADPTKVNNNFASILAALQTLGLVKN